MFTFKLISRSLIKKQIHFVGRLYSNNKISNQIKRSCIVSTVGAQSSGKSTLAEVLRKVSGEQFKFDLKPTIDSGVRDVLYGQYRANDTQIVHLDVVSMPPKNMMTSSYGVDIGIVVVDLSQGMTSQTKEHIKLLTFQGVEHFIVYLNKSDLDADGTLRELIIDEMRNYFEKHNIKLDDESIVSGSALNVLESKDESHDRQSIVQVLELIDSKSLQLPREQQMKKPALYSIKRSHTKMNKGTEVTGYMRQGVFKRNDIVTICGHDRTFKTKIQEIESFGEQLDTVQPGVSASLLLKSIKRDDIQRGMLIMHPDNETIVMTDHFKANFYLYEKNEMLTRFHELTDDQTSTIFARTFNVRTIFKIEGDKKVLYPGERGQIVFKLLKTMPLEKGMRFILHKESSIGVGEITELLPSFEYEFLNKAKRN